MTRNRRIEDLIEEWSPEIKAAFLLSIRNIKDAAQIGVIIKMLERGDINAALDAAHMEPAMFRPYDKAVMAAYEAGGIFAVGGLPNVTGPNGHVLQTMFNVRATNAISFAERYAGQRITLLADAARLTARNHIVAGLERGDNPARVALDLVGRISPVTRKREGGAIGLTDSQEVWVRKYKVELSDPKTALQALTRNLRDKRFDATVRKAVKAGKPLTAEQIGKMVETYRNRALRFRASAIARTEAMTALHAGQEEGIRQAVEKGVMQDADVIKVWSSTGDKKVRDSHRALDGERVRGIDGLFISPSGATLRFPGDPDAPASEICNCRCWMSYRVDVTRGLD